MVSQAFHEGILVMVLIVLLFRPKFTGNFAEDYDHMHTKSFLRGFW